MMIVAELPKVELPNDETLNNEDKHFLEAFKSILNGYKRSQFRLRKLSKDYTILQTLASELLKERQQKSADKSPQKPATVSDRVSVKKPSPLKLPEDGLSEEDILMVDLTCESETLEQAARAAGTTSPVFGRNWDRRNDSTSRESPVKKPEQLFDTNNETSRDESALEREGNEGNEENCPPFTSTSFKISENESNITFNESKPVARIGIAKSVYSVDAYRTPNGKRMKQSTLKLEPQIPKKLSNCTEKPPVKLNFTLLWDDLYSDNYRKNKKADETPENTKAQIIDSKTGKESPKKADEFVEQREKAFLTETPSQINESARSLFEDEGDFDVSDDLLNTCLDAPVVEAAVHPPANGKVLKEKSKSEEEPSTSKVTQFPADSIDETFFPLGELEMTKKTPKAENKTANSTVGENSRDQNRNLKRKSTEDTLFGDEKESQDFGAQDIDWDADMTTDDWPRALDNSFDIVPDKKKAKSPVYAYKGKVERNQAERKKLRGWDCKDCENYYANKNLSEKELQKHMNRCSRHRSKFNPRYCTPKDFWNPLFPPTADSSDCSDDEIRLRTKK